MMYRKIFLVLSFLIFGITANAQSLDKITRQCKPPNNRSFGTILVQGNGDIVHTPCPTRSSIFTGGVDFANATVTGLPGLGNVSGTGTTNFVTRWTNGAGGVIGNTPFSWDGTEYVFNNTTLDSQFRINFTPDAAPGSSDGLYTIGDQTGVQRNFIVVDNTGVVSLQAEGNTNIGAEGGAINLISGAGGATTFIVDGAADTITGAVSTSQLLMDGGTNTITITSGTATNISAGTSFDVVAAGATNITAGTTAGFASTGNMFLRNGTTAGAIFNSAAGTVIIGDLAGATSALFIDDNGIAQIGGTTETQLGNNPSSLRAIVSSDTLRSTLSIWDTSAAGGAGFGVTNFLFNRTITAAGTTGAQTINLPVGTVNFAAAATAITVTNSTVTVNSIIFGIARTNDATCSVKNIVPAAGSFVINMTNACTGETSVGFQVTN